jgi:hypothetical protein
MLTYEEFKKDNPFNLNQQSFNRIHKYIDCNYKKKRVSRKIETMRLIRQRNDGTYSCFDEFASNEIGTIIQPYTLKEFYNPYIRHKATRLFWMMKKDKRFKRVDDVKGRSAFVIVGE